MKKNLIILIAFLFYNNVSFSQNWHTDFSEAQKLAEEQQRKIVLVFSGSDWCGLCIKLDKKIWKSTEFKDFAGNNLILLKVDFPRKKKNKLSKEQQKHNDLLADKYHAEFPLVVVLNSKSEVLGRIGFKKNYSPQDYINYISDL